MEFYNTVTIIKTLSEDEWGTTDLVELNGVFGMTEKYGISEPGGFYAITEEEAKELM